MLIITNVKVVIRCFYFVNLERYGKLIVEYKWRKEKKNAIYYGSVITYQEVPCI